MSNHKNSSLNFYDKKRPNQCFVIFFLSLFFAKKNFIDCFTYLKKIQFSILHCKLTTLLIFYVKLDLLVNFFLPILNIFSILLQARLYLWEVVLVYLFRIALPLTRQIIKSMGNAFLYVFHYFNWLALVPHTNSH